jgi:hypothetical protein
MLISPVLVASRVSTPVGHHEQVHLESILKDRVEAYECKKINQAPSSRANRKAHSIAAVAPKYARMYHMVYSLPSKATISSVSYQVRPQATAYQSATNRKLHLAI